MSTDFTNIGFDVKSSEDVYNLIEKCSDDRKKYYKFKDRNFLVIKPDSNSELYYYGDSEGINGAFCEIYYDSPRVITGENWGWVSKPEDELSPELIQVYVDNGKTDFPLNVMILDSFVYADLKLSGELPHLTDVPSFQMGLLQGSFFFRTAYSRCPIPVGLLAFAMRVVNHFYSCKVRKCSSFKNI